MNQNSAFVMKNNGKMYIGDEAESLNAVQKMFVDPFLENLPNLFVSYFVKILKVGYKIPRLEYYMTNGNLSVSIRNFVKA